MFRLTLYITLLLLTGCGSSVSFVSILDMPNTTWKNNESIEFDYQNADSVNQKSINLIVRHTPDFKYDRLLLEIRTTNPAKKYWCDTISIALTDSNNNWLGHNQTTHYDINTLYRKNTKFNLKGDYNIRVRYLYPADSLEGIKAMGLTIE